jgi:hypothetical protein
VRNRQFKFFSTEFPAAGLQDLGSGRIRPTMISGLALTNLPNNKGGLPISNREPAVLENPTQPNPTNEATMKNIAKKLGLSEEATEEQILNRVGELQTENADIKKQADETAADAVAEQTYAIDGNAEAGNRLVERVDELETEVKFLESKIGILESQIESDGKTIDFLLSEAQKIP